MFFGIIAGTMVLSSFTELKQECVKNGMNAPTYWEGRASCCDGYSSISSYYLNIKVYQTEGMCNSFYAVVVDGNCFAGVSAGDELWVKENPKYDPTGIGCWTSYKYMVTYRDYNFYFNM